MYDASILVSFRAVLLKWNISHYFTVVIGVCIVFPPEPDHTLFHIFRPVSWDYRTQVIAINVKGKLLKCPALTSVRCDAFVDLISAGSVGCPCGRIQRGGKIDHIDVLRINADAAGIMVLGDIEVWSCIAYFKFAPLLLPGIKPGIPVAQVQPFVPIR